MPFRIFQEGPSVMGLEDVLGEHRVSEGEPVTGQNHIASTEDHQGLTKYHLGTGQGDDPSRCYRRKLRYDRYIFGRKQVL